MEWLGAISAMPSQQQEWLILLSAECADLNGDSSEEYEMP